MNLDDQADQDAALTIACPITRCHAPIGDFCRNTGEPLDRLPAHDARLKAAGVAHAPLDSRYLRNPERSWTR